MIFFLFSSFAATVRRKQKFMQLYRFWVGIVKKEINWNWTLDQTRTAVVWCHVSHICPVAADDKKSVWVCVYAWKHLPKPSKAETKIQIKSLYTFILYSLPTINLCNGIYHFNFRHIGNTLVTVFYSSYPPFPFLPTLITQPRPQPHSFNMLCMFIKSIYTPPPTLNSQSLSPTLLFHQLKTVSLCIVFSSFITFFSKWNPPLI